MGTIFDLYTIPVYLINIVGNLLCAFKETQPCITSTHFPLVSLKNWLIIDSIQPILTTAVLLINFMKLTNANKEKQKRQNQSVCEYYRKSLPLYLMRNIWLGLGIYGFFFTLPSDESSGWVKYYLGGSIVTNFLLLTFRHFMVFSDFKNPFTEKWYLKADQKQK